ncbi:MAG: hypothetical protein WCI74_14505, partial [Actinomycetes bacterium]
MTRPAHIRRLVGCLRLIAPGLLFTVVVFAGVPGAIANFGPHAPGITPDADSCAMCHRAHTSYSTIGWTDTLGTVHATALLAGSSATTTGYCLVCHGDGAPGASTNVMSGIFEGSSEYETSSTPGAPLNAGGFAAMPDPYAWDASGTVNIVPTTSMHNLDTGPLPLWGAGTTLASTPGLTCTSCHDPHPTSNYRMLKGLANSTTVGGYSSDESKTPNAFVFSTETGYPVPSVDASNPAGGFLKGTAGADQVARYRPNYTGGSLLNITATEPDKSLSVWCSSCHTGYRQTSALTTVVVNYGVYEANPVTGAQVGAMDRHFHPSDVTLQRGFGPDRMLPATVTPSPYWVPLEKAQSGSGEFWKDYIGCHTCHRAHGSSTVMTGWAASHLETNSAGAWVPVQD